MLLFQLLRVASCEVFEGMWLNQATGDRCWLIATQRLSWLLYEGNFVIACKCGIGGKTHLDE